MSETRPAEGWYEDPRNHGYVRWWDGEKWTSRTEKKRRARTGAPVAQKASEPAEANPVTVPPQGTGALQQSTPSTDAARVGEAEREPLVRRGGDFLVGNVPQPKGETAPPNAARTSVGRVVESGPGMMDEYSMLPPPMAVKPLSVVQSPAQALMGRRMQAAFLDVMLTMPAYVLLMVGGFLRAAGANQNTRGGSSVDIGRLAVYFILGGAAIWVLTVGLNSVWKVGKTGQSFGKRATKLQVVDFTTREPIGFKRAVVRLVPRVALTAGLFFLGSVAVLLWFLNHVVVLFEKNGRRVGDYMAKSIVVPEREMTP